MSIRKTPRQNVPQGHRAMGNSYHATLQQVPYLSIIHQLTLVAVTSLVTSRLTQSKGFSKGTSDHRVDHDHWKEANNHGRSGLSDRLTVQRRPTQEQNGAHLHQSQGRVCGGGDSPTSSSLIPVPTPTTVDNLRKEGWPMWSTTHTLKVRKAQKVGL